MSTPRAILRNRVRRHPDQLLIQQALEGYGASNASDLKLADLKTLAAEFGLSVPTSAEVAAYEACRASGGSFAAAVAAADAASPAPLNLTAAPAEPEAEPEAEQDEEPDNEAAASATTPAQEAETEVEAEALAKDVLRLLGAGDVLGFNTALRDVARRAVRPDPLPQTVYLTAPGALPTGAANRVGAKDMQQAGIGQPMTGDVKKTALAVYDAADAPRVDASYIWPDATGAMLTQMARGRTVFITGPAGTGKTTWAQQVAARWGRTFVRISCDDQTEAATLVGMTVPSKSGGTEWQDGQLTAAIRRPGTVILVDEPSVARPGALFVLQAVLDSDRKIHIAETGEVVHCAPDVVFVLADNTNGTGDITGAYEATRRLNRAFLDRAGVTVRFDYMSKEEEARALVARTGCSKKLAGELARFAGLTRQKAVRGEVSHPIGIRRLLALAELMTDGVVPVMAFQMAVIETAPFDDQEPLRQMFVADFKASSAGIIPPASVNPAI